MAHLVGLLLLHARLPAMTIRAGAVAAVTVARPRWNAMSDGFITITGGKLRSIG